MGKKFKYPIIVFLEHKITNDMGKIDFQGMMKRNWTKKPSVSAQNKTVNDHKNVFDRS
jgi:hypothetical protein